MINERLIEHINELKNKRISDVEITDILLLNNYTAEEIKENLNHYNNIHGFSSNNYIEEYEKIQGKKFSEVEDFKEKVVSDKKNYDQKVKDIKREEPAVKVEKKEPLVTSEKKKMSKGDLISIVAIIVLLAFIIYVIISYDVINKIILKM
jgi:hypothetical protein